MLIRNKHWLEYIFLSNCCAIDFFFGLFGCLKRAYCFFLAVQHKIIFQVIYAHMTKMTHFKSVHLRGKAEAGASPIFAALKDLPVQPVFLR